MKQTLESMLIRIEDRRSFERERLLNLIDSKVRRREVDVARGFAEELYDNEIGFLLRERTRAMARYDELLMSMTICMVAVLATSAALTVLNVSPFLSLKVLAASTVSSFALVVLESLLHKRFGVFLQRVAEGYENQKRLFVERVLTGVAGSMPVDLRLDFAA
jgi:hypothetical protein